MSLRCFLSISCTDEAQTQLLHFLEAIGLGFDNWDDFFRASDRYSDETMEKCYRIWNGSVVNYCVGGGVWWWVGEGAGWVAVD